MPKELVTVLELQQHLPFRVYAEGCKTAEAQSSDEDRISQVPERSEGKTKAIRLQSYNFIFHIKRVNRWIHSFFRLSFLE